MIKRWISIVMVLFLIATNFPQYAHADSLDEWSIRSPLPTGNVLYGVTYGNGKYVAVGANGTIVTSSDGASWMSRTSGTANHLLGVTYGNGTYVAVGISGTILTSTDGANWTSRTSDDIPVNLNSVTFVNGKYVAVGESGTIAISSDGASWTNLTRDIDIPYNLFSVTYGKGTYVAVGYYGVTVTSSDEVNWTSRSGDSTDNLFGVTYFNETFVAVGNNGKIKTSSDGESWASQRIGTFLNGVTYGNGMYVAVGESGKIVTSGDGTIWTSQTSGTTKDLRGVTYGNGTYVAVGNNGAIVTSSDGESWTSRTSAITNDLYGVTYGNDTYAAVGADGTIVTSGDGASWTSRTSGTSDYLYGVTVENGTYVAVGSSGTILTSSDGADWTSRTSGTPRTLYGVAYGNGKYVAVGASGTIVASSEGADWTNQTSSTTNYLFSVTYDNDTYVAVGDAGTILTSSDGANWMSRTSGTPNALFGVTYENGTYVAVGAAGTIVTSSDGVSWTGGTSGTTSTLRGITYSNGMYVAVGENGTIVTSSDGASWTSRSSGTTNHLFGVTYGNGTYLAVGMTGTIVQSAPAPAVNSVGVSPSSTNVVQGGSKQLTASVDTVGGAATTVMWTSSDASNKVAVDGTGNVTVAANAFPGYYTITATSTVDGSKKGTATITVTAAGSTIFNQDGIGYSGTIVPAPIGPTVSMAVYNNWPSNLSRGSFAFSGGVFDGQHIWMIPYTADSLLKVDKDTGAMTAYNNWPSGFHKTISSGTTTVIQAFQGGVYDGKSIWLIPYSADRIIRVDKNTGEMTGYSDWPEGTTSIGATAFMGGFFDGRNIWLVPYKVNKVIKFDTVTGVMTGYEGWPAGFDHGTYAFGGGLFDGQNVWLIPNEANQVIKIDPDSGTMTGYSNWPADFSKTTARFTGGIFDGQNVWLIPSNADRVIKMNTTDGTMTSYNNWPDGITDKYFFGGAFDGQNIWMIPASANSSVVKMNTDTGEMTGYRNWSDEINGGSMPFRGGVFDGDSIWMIPFKADGLVKLGNPVYTLTYTAGANGTITGNVTQTVKSGGSGTAVTAVANSGYHFVEWSDGKTQATRTDTNITANLSETATFAKDRTSGSSASTTPETTGNGVDILVNGKVENAGTAVTSKRNDQTVTTVVVDQKKLNDKLAAEGQGAVVTIPVAAKSDVFIGELNGQMVKSMEGKQAVVEFKTDKATYTLPAQQINIDAVSDKIGKSVALQDIKVQIEIAAPTADKVKVAEDAAEKGTFTLVVPPVEFTVKAIYGEKTVEVSTFNAYVHRTIAIPDGVDPNKITTGIVVEPDGSVRHVPTKIVVIDGKYYATINSLTNSTYSVVWHPLEFSDVANHWAKNAVNNMGSRMVIEGTGGGRFSPDRDITRAEFAAIVVRGMGLKLDNGAPPFSDVKATDWYNGAVNTAYAYNLITGFEDGTFRPNDNITREQAMVVLSKAMKVTGLKDKLSVPSADAALRPFGDAAEVSPWAQSSVADSVQAGIVSGRSNAKLVPTDFMTRAEVATMIQKLLQKSGLI